MTDGLDRILVSEPVVSPSGDFASRVMRAVRRSCDQFAPLPFPWQRFAMGLVGGLVCLSITIMVLTSGPGLNRVVFDATAWLQTFNPNVLSMTVALIVSLAVVRLSVAYAGE